MCVEPGMTSSVTGYHAMAEAFAAVLWPQG